MSRGGKGAATGTDGAPVVRFCAAPRTLRARPPSTIRCSARFSPEGSTRATARRAWLRRDPSVIVKSSSSSDALSAITVAAGAESVQNPTTAKSSQLTSASTNRADSTDSTPEAALQGTAEPECPDPTADLPCTQLLDYPVEGIY